MADLETDTRADQRWPWWPLLFHARDSGEEPLQDGPQQRRLGWARLVLLANYLCPAPLDVRGTGAVLAGGFRKGVRSAQAHFGLYPFAWREGWQREAEGLMGGVVPRLQVAPVLERLVFPRARSTYLRWLRLLEAMEELRWLVPAHHSAPIACGPDAIRAFRERSGTAPVGSKRRLLGVFGRPGHATCQARPRVPDDPEGGGSGR